MKPFGNLFGNGDITTAGKWVDAANNAILAVKAAGGGGLGASSINGYLNSLNFGPTTNTNNVALTATSFSVAGNGTVSVKLAGRTQATKFSPIAVAQLAYNNGWTDVMTIKPTSLPQPSLWWETSFHAMAIAGLGGLDEIRVADPDSVPRNAGNSNGGWWNWSKLKDQTTLVGANAEATASLDAAITAVNANIYTKAQAGGPPPVPGAGGYTAGNLYGSITLGSDMGQTHQITAASNANYGGKTKVDTFNLINTVAMTKKFIAPPPPEFGTDVNGVIAEGDPTFQNTFVWTGNIAADVQRIQIFPVVPLADNNFTFSEPSWSTAPVSIDPFDGIWSGGGVDISAPPGSYLIPGEVAEATFNTTAPVTQYNIFFQMTNDDWMVQTFGAEDNAFGDQLDFVAAIPEPATLGLLLVGLAALVLQRRHR
jgi:hypothetical protein